MPPICAADMGGIILRCEIMPGFRPFGALLEAVFATRFLTKEMGRIRQDVKRVAERESGAKGA